MQFAKWAKDVDFVCRLNDNAKFQVQEVLFESRMRKVNMLCIV